MHAPYTGIGSYMWSANYRGLIEAWCTAPLILLEWDYSGLDLKAILHGLRTRAHGHMEFPSQVSTFWRPRSVRVECPTASKPGPLHGYANTRAPEPSTNQRIIHIEILR